MQNWFKYFIAFSFGIVAMLYIFRLCSPKNTSEITIVTTIDTVRITDTVYVPKFQNIRIIDTVQLATAADTARIIDDYRQLRAYNDTLRDSVFTVFLCDSVFGNQIIARSWHGESYQRTTVITKEPPILKKWRYGIGAGGLYSQSMCAPAVFVSAERQRFMFFGVMGTNCIGAGVSIRLYNER